MAVVTSVRKGLPIVHKAYKLVINPDAKSVGVHSYEEATFPDNTTGKNGHTDNFAKSFGSVEKLCAEKNIPYAMIMAGVVSIFEALQEQRLEELANPKKVERKVV